MLKRIAIGVLLAASIIGPAWAACTTHTYMVNGRYVVCTTCCHGSICSTSCL